MSERWLPVVGYEGLYEVSDEGRVRYHVWMFYFWLSGKLPARLVYWCAMRVSAHSMEPGISILDAISRWHADKIAPPQNDTEKTSDKSFKE